MELTKSKVYVLVLQYWCESELRYQCPSEADVEVFTSEATARNYAYKLRNKQHRPFIYTIYEKIIN